MKFVFDESKMTWMDLAEMEEGRTTRQTIEFMAKFVTDDSERPVSETVSLKFVASLSIPAARDATRQFREWIKSLRDSAVNPPTAAS